MNSIYRTRRAILVLLLSICVGHASCAPGEAPAGAELLLAGGLVYDGSGGEPVDADVVVSEGRIWFVGDATLAGFEAADTVDVRGLMVTPGFIDMHSHAELDEEYGRDALPFLYQGITTVALGLDGGGPPAVAERLAGWADAGIGVNAFTFVGHGAVREAVLGREDRAPEPDELQRMRDLVRQGMEGGAFGLSTGLFYVPGFYATTEEVIDLNRVAAEYGGIYDTHDRDLGAAYNGIGYLASIREAIRIGEEAGTPVIFSHFNAQGAANYGRAPEGAALIEEARARGVEVAAAQHVYTATQASLRAYAIPRWAAAGGQDALLARFAHPTPQPSSTCRPWRCSRSGVGQRRSCSRIRAPCSTAGPSRTSPRDGVCPCRRRSDASCRTGTRP